MLGAAAILQGALVEGCTLRGVAVRGTEEDRRIWAGPRAVEAVTCCALVRCRVAAALVDGLRI